MGGSVRKSFLTCEELAELDATHDHRVASYYRGVAKTMAELDPAERRNYIWLLARQIEDGWLCVMMGEVDHGQIKVDDFVEAMQLRKSFRYWLWSLWRRK